MFVLHTYERYHKKDRKEMNSFVFVAKPEYCAKNNAQDHILYNKWTSGLLKWALSTLHTEARLLELIVCNGVIKN